MDTPRILLIEDEADLAEAVATLLRHEGYAVDHYDNGNSGYDALVEGRYDVAVVDVLLPGRNGFAICRDARNAGITTPILVLTAKTGVFDEAEALELGADDFLSKPFQPVVLIARIAALRRRARDINSGTETDTDSGPLRFDSQRHTVVYRGTVAKLSPREHQLLAALAAGDGEPVTKEKLLEDVWDGNGDPNTVEVYVGYLRKKLIAAFGADVRVDTVRWVGYRLIIA